MTAEDISAEAAAKRARFRAQRDADILKIEELARADLRTVHPKLRPIATARKSYLLDLADSLRQANTQAMYDAVTRAFDTGFTEIDAQFTQTRLELEQEQERDKAIARQQEEWKANRAIAVKERKALPVGTSPKLHKRAKHAGRVPIHKNWAPIYGQTLFPQSAPLNAQQCEHCRNGIPAMYWVVGPQFSNGKGLCDRCAEGERYAPQTQVYLINWT
ncbi:MAG: hypothetical protein ACREQ5_13595 [Candidatus Dormibacteria bacterium]